LVSQLRTKGAKLLFQFGHVDFEALYRAFTIAKGTFVVLFRHVFGITIAHHEQILNVWRAFGKVVQLVDWKVVHRRVALMLGAASN